MSPENFMVEPLH